MAFDSFRPASPTPKSFRHDINGLRAWAVLAVVFYHFGVPGFSGGFIGVDVFFVISGFLMTAIIVNGLERGNFSFSKTRTEQSPCSLSSIIARPTGTDARNAA